MQDNPYAPPKADVEGVPGEAVAAPPLWNPNAAASWSLLFTPIFGTWLHWKNWVALGETKRAATARMWLIASMVFVVASMVLASAEARLAGPVRLVNFAFLIAWYYTGAKPQVASVKERFGDGYPRRGWALPIMIAIGAIIGSLVVIAVAIAMGAA